MFRTLIYPSLGACDYSVELPHWFFVLGSMCVGVSVWLVWSGIHVAGWNSSYYVCAQHVSGINISIIRSLRLFCSITTLVVLFLVRCVLEFRCGIRVAGWGTSACNTDTTPTQPHRNSNTHRAKNNTTNVVIQQNSRKLLMMDILMSETCWARTKWNKITSDIKLVFYSSTIKVVIWTVNFGCSWHGNNCTFQLHYY